MFFQLHNINTLICSQLLVWQLLLSRSSHRVSRSTVAQRCYYIHSDYCWATLLQSLADKMTYSDGFFSPYNNSSEVLQEATGELIAGV